MLVCQFCDKNFQRNSALTNHQKTAKYCLVKRGKIVSDEKKEIIIHECKYCNKILSNKQNLNIHLQTCIERYDTILKEKDDIISELKLQIKNQEDNLKLQIKTLETEVIELRLQNKIYKELSTNTQECIQSIAKQPKNQTNLFLSPIDLSQEHITKMIQEKFTKEHFYDGQAGVARFAVDNILKDKDGKLGYICTDPSRQIFKHITSDGEVKKDVRASKLTKKIAKDVKKVSGEIVLKRMEETNESTEFKKFDKDVCLDFLTKKMDEIAVIDDDSSKFRAELANLTVEK